MSTQTHGIKIGIIGGSGLGELLAAQTSGHRHEMDTPFGAPSDAITESEWNGLPVFFLSRHGPGHLYNPSQVPFRANIFALKKLGCTHIIASGAVGSLREELRPRDLVIADQIIDKTHKRSNTFYDKAAVHVEFAEPFCPVLRQILLKAGTELQSNGTGSAELQAFKIHERGCYVAMEGPAFSTRAESVMHRLWGGDLIGMTAMPEAKLAKEAEISYAMISLVTDYDCWRTVDSHKHSSDPLALLTEIISHLKSASSNAILLMKKAIDSIAKNPELLANCPAQKALQLAIWSDKKKIDATEVQRLAPLWMKYME